MDLAPVGGRTLTSPSLPLFWHRDKKFSQGLGALCSAQA